MKMEQLSLVQLKVIDFGVKSSNTIFQKLNGLLTLKQFCLEQLLEMSKFMIMLETFYFLSKSLQKETVKNLHLLTSNGLSHQELDTIMKKQAEMPLLFVLHIKVE